MILADSFVKSSKARESEFTTNKGDRPLIVQFAAKNPSDFANAAEMVRSYTDGVDLNCGCPQKWAMNEGYGASLLKKPHLIRDIILQVKNRIPGPFTVSVKLRIMENLRSTVELCRTLESAGVSFLTVHARTPVQKHQPINEEALCEIKRSIGVPMIANGDVKSLVGAEELHQKTGCDGVMAARGILANPAFFAGHPVTPLCCVQDWVTISTATGTPFQCFHHHLVFMLEKILPKPKRLIFNVLKKREHVLSFLEEYGITCNKEVNTKSAFSAVDCDYGTNTLDEGTYFKEKIDNLRTPIESEDYLEDSCDLYST
ncbi:tRNA-dihydrouridine(20a/20b) synthase [NAD(P)+]-like isoform X2 [Periplaneta americana]